MAVSRPDLQDRLYPVPMDRMNHANLTPAVIRNRYDRLSRHNISNWPPCAVGHENTLRPLYTPVIIRRLEQVHVLVVALQVYHRAVCQGDGRHHAGGVPLGATQEVRWDGSWHALLRVPDQLGHQNLSDLLPNTLSADQPLVRHPYGYQPVRVPLREPWPVPQGVRHIFRYSARRFSGTVATGCDPNKFRVSVEKSLLLVRPERDEFLRDRVPAHGVVLDRPVLLPPLQEGFEAVDLVLDFLDLL